MKKTIGTLLACAFLCGCGGGEQLASTWNDGTITVDGDAAEWTSHLWYLKNEHISLGIRNDRDYLYVCLLSSEDQFRRQMMGLGLTVTFESEKGGKVGVHYPLGRIGRARGERGAGPDQSPPDGGAYTEVNDAPEAELLGPKEEQKQRVPVVQMQGVSVKMGSWNGQVVYELKVPLAATSDHPFAIGADAGSEIKLSIATGKFDEGSRPRGGEGGFGGGRGGRRGGGGGMGGGMGGGGRMGRGGGGDEPSGEGVPSPGGRPEPVDFHATVKLQAGTGS